MRSIGSTTPQRAALLLATVALALASAALLLAPPAAHAQRDRRELLDRPVRGSRVGVDLVELGRYRAPGAAFGEGGAEIVAHDPGSQRLFVANGAEGTLDVLDLADPAAPGLVTQLDLSSYGAGINGVGAGGGLVGVAVAPDDAQAARGRAVFVDPDTLDILADVEVGYLPDALLFTPDGRRAVIANEGEPSADYDVDPPGSVSIVDVDDFTVTEATFDHLRATDLDETTRIFGPGATIAQDLEPENVAFSTDSRTAYVTLQENNAIAVVDLDDARISDVVGVGVVDHTDPVHGLDPSNADGEIAIRDWPVTGIRQPDAIGAFRAGARTYLAIANEGDARDYDGFSEEARLGDVGLCPELTYDGFSAAELQADELLGRLQITTVHGVDEERGCVEDIHAYGARSFSIHTTDGRVVFDSGRQFEEITAEILGRNGFNANNDESGPDAFDSRSDDKGPEPEGIAIGRAYGNTYAFIGLERVGGIMTYRVTDPADAEFVDYVTGRDFAAEDPEDSVDLGPEGVVFVEGGDSPTGRPLVVVSHEVTGTTTIYQVDPVLPGRLRP